MNTVGIVDKAEIKNGERKVKVLLTGKQNVQETDDISLPGIDASPIKGMVAIYSETQVKGEEVIIGYINPNQIAEPGEIRIFALDDSGNEKCYSWFKKDGTIELDGDTDNAVRYSKLAEAYNETNNKLNALITAFNSHVHILSLTSGTGTAAPTAAPAQTSTGDISPAKIENIKTS
ncbi:MAG: hypothetical protein WC756_03765 [Taibaiella sp.]|jgi:hypothetical protein